MKNKKILYENDMPVEGRRKSYWDRKGRRQSIYNTVLSYKYKPQGITDNRAVYEKKKQTVDKREEVFRLKYLVRKVWSGLKKTGKKNTRVTSQTT